MHHPPGLKIGKEKGAGKDGSAALVACASSRGAAHV